MSHLGMNRPMQSVMMGRVGCVCVETPGLIHQVSERNQEALGVTIPLTLFPASLSRSFPVALRLSSSFAGDKLIETD